MYPNMPLIQESYVERILKAKVYDVAGSRAAGCRLRLGRKSCARRCAGGAHPRHPAVIVMPLTTPEIKVQAVADLHINELHYAYTEETDNPAYRLFLGH